MVAGGKLILPPIFLRWYKVFIKEVKTISEFKYLMKKLEREMPDLRWLEGQKPTEWINHDPTGYPKKIYIQNSNNKLACWER